MSGLKTRPGHIFTPINLWNEADYDPPINALINVESLVQVACDLENARFLADADDAEGIELSSRPPSPLTPLPTDYESDELEADLTPHPSNPQISGAFSDPYNGRATQIPPGSIERKRKRQGAKERRRKKRIEKATSGHAPQNYAANPSLVEALTKDSHPLQLDIDASALPSSSVGAWEGKRAAGKRDTPWTPKELDELGFSEVIWCGS